jgi:hypothetical protein
MEFSDCPICYEEFKEEPWCFFGYKSVITKYLKYNSPCDHYVCQPCFHELIHNGNYKCPLCRCDWLKYMCNLCSDLIKLKKIQERLYTNISISNWIYIGCIDCENNWDKCKCICESEDKLVFHYKYECLGCEGYCWELLEENYQKYYRDLYSKIITYFNSLKNKSIITIKNYEKLNNNFRIIYE